MIGENMERFLLRWLLKRMKRRLERRMGTAAWSRELSNRLDCVIWLMEDDDGK